MRGERGTFERLPLMEIREVHPTDPSEFLRGFLCGRLTRQPVGLIFTWNDQAADGLSVLAGLGITYAKSGNSGVRLRQTAQNSAIASFLAFEAAERRELKEIADVGGLEDQGSVREVAVQLANDHPSLGVVPPRASSAMEELVVRLTPSPLPLKAIDRRLLWNRATSAVVQRLEPKFARAFMPRGKRARALYWMPQKHRPCQFVWAAAVANVGEFVEGGPKAIENFAEGAKKFFPPDAGTVIDWDRFWIEFAGVERSMLLLRGVDWEELRKRWAAPSYELPASLFLPAPERPPRNLEEEAFIAGFISGMGAMAGGCVTIPPLSQDEARRFVQNLGAAHGFALRPRFAPTMLVAPTSIVELARLASVGMLEGRQRDAFEAGRSLGVAARQPAPQAQWEELRQAAQPWARLFV